MKRLSFFESVLCILCVASLFVSCGGGSSNGQLTGVQHRPGWRTEIPYGMTTVPTGTLVLGSSDQDVTFELTARPRQVTIGGFYMDETEITNNEYRQFVQYVIDSNDRTILQLFVQNNNAEEVTAGNPPIDWKKKINYKDPEVNNQLSAMYLSQDQWINGKREYDLSKLVYKYDYLSYKSAASSKNSRNKDRRQHVKQKPVTVYPDTLVWTRDFTYSYNEPFTRNYYSHPAFDNYPLVGVTWDQANAFSYWRTNMWNQYRTSRGRPEVEVFRLPTEFEWEYAARGGKKNTPYPWGGPYTRNHKGCLLANFKPTRGNYQEDGGFKTVRVDSYFPNDYGLYNMAGNVSEWTVSAYYENTYSFVHDHNPDIKYDHTKLDNETMKRKVIRGGSWKDVAFFIQNGTRIYEYADSAKSYVGFRCITSMLK
ncbi:MAG: SUMF1/EgtB/PvdO family nonheme iron enzyme [Chitinophagales bacterium]|jgi:sulfatase modifying factor 1|nr:SUMF1/EgtB/PvdO family nonheme iron enzyme [Sphingobacteriales bacterium]